MVVQWSVCVRGIREACSGPYFPDWEFETLIGFRREFVECIAAEEEVSKRKWGSDEVSAILNVANNIEGYPHGYASRFTERVGMSPGEFAVLVRSFASQLSVDERRDP